LTIPSTQFAQDSSSGISSLGINLKSFIFQLITFLIVLMILRRWVYPKLVATLEERRKTLEESLIQAKQTEEALQKAEARSAELLQKARVQADAALADASSRAEEIIAKGEEAASVRAARIVKEAEEHLSQERQQLHDELRKELAGLVAVATEKVLAKKLDEREDRALIERSLKEIG
jgi:F-type H+-transporting ATPase subunit b